MRENLKTVGFFFLVALLCVVPILNRDIARGKRKLSEESENARDLYTGKTRAVYDPIDTAYVVTDELRELIQKEDDSKFKQYKKWPVVSVKIDPKELHDEDRGIFKNQLKKGRLWERASYISYYEKGEKLFSSFAGVRVHGGANRARTLKSFRFNFRKSIGEDSFLKNLEISQIPGTPIKRLLLRHDRVLNFASDLGYSLVRKLGGRAPNIKHVAVYLNGEFYQYMQMTEQLHTEQAKYEFGNDRFVYYKLKSSNSTKDRLLYENAIHKVKGASKPINFKDIEKQFDLDNFTALMVGITYMNLHDWAQGVWFKNLNLDDDKWKISTWDFDMAFIGYKTHVGPHWEIDGFDILMNNYLASLGSRLFHRLIKESPEYREFFSRKVDVLFEEVLTDEFLESKFREYESFASDVPENTELKQSIASMRSFIKHRKSYFCKQMNAAIKIRPQTCRI